MNAGRAAAQQGHAAARQRLHCLAARSSPLPHPSSVYTLRAGDGPLQLQRLQCTRQGYRQLADRHAAPTRWQSTSHKRKGTGLVSEHVVEASPSQLLSVSVAAFASAAYSPFFVDRYAFLCLGLRVSFMYPASHRFRFPN